MFAVRSRESSSCMYIKLPFLQLIIIWISNFLPQGQLLVDCMFSQPYRSSVKSENCCLDNSNPNSVTGSTVNQFETPVRVDISARRFSLSLISVINLLMTFLYFSSIDFFVSVLSFFRLSTRLLLYCKLLKWCSKFSYDFAGVHKFNFRCFMIYWNVKFTVPRTWLEDKLVLFPCHCIRGIFL